jgi:hypothetical protein
MPDATSQPLSARALQQGRDVTSGREPDQDGRLARLVRDGIARPARGAIPDGLFRERPPSAKPGLSAVAVLIRERRAGK